jgi:transcription antitermination factor NusG
MNGGQQVLPVTSSLAAVAMAIAPRWYAVQTRGRHEKKVANKLSEKGIDTYLPALREVHRWSDRNKVVEVPLFPCYTFVRVAADSSERLRILQTDGVVRMVGNGTELCPIDERQIEDIRTLLGTKMPVMMYPFLKIGQRIRVRSGALNGLEGILVSRPKESTLVISIDAIQRAIAINVDGYQIEAI